LAFTGAGLVSGYAGSFTQGGIVPGSSYSGDKLTARVNSGERIMTQEQQRLLTDMLSGRSQPGSSAPINLVSTLVVDGKEMARSVTRYQDNNLAGSKKK